MVYAITIIAIVVLIINYDWGRKVNNKNAGNWYNALLIWFIAISGFAYNVGSDTPIYMYEYDATLWSKYPNFLDLFNSDNDREPGWILLGLICHSVSPNFAFFKIVIAFFCNWAVFRFIKRHSISPFTSILFYAIILYLHINFNSIRQAIAIGFFLLAYDKLIEKKWAKYNLLVLAAMFFHRSAIICLLIPLFYFIRINKKTYWVVGILLIASVFLFLTIDTQNLIYGVLMSNPEMFLDEDLQRFDVYFGGEMGGSRLSIIGLVYIAIQVLMLVIVLIISVKVPKIDRLTITVFVFYIILFILNAAIPVFFSRVLQYFDVFYICLLPIAIQRISVHFTKKKILCPALVILFAFFPMANLLSINQRTEIPMIAQYYPYYSIFNPQIDPVRNTHFGSHR